MNRNGRKQTETDRNRQKQKEVVRKFYQVQASLCNFSQAYQKKETDRWTKTDKTGGTGQKRVDTEVNREKLMASERNREKRTEATEINRN